MTPNRQKILRGLYRLLLDYLLHRRATSITALMIADVVIGYEFAVHHLGECERRREAEHIADNDRDIASRHSG